MMPIYRLACTVFVSLLCGISGFCQPPQERQRIDSIAAMVDSDSAQIEKFITGAMDEEGSFRGKAFFSGSGDFQKAVFLTDSLTNYSVYIKNGTVMKIVSHRSGNEHAYYNIRGTYYNRSDAQVAGTVYLRLRSAEKIIEGLKLIYAGDD